VRWHHPERGMVSPVEFIGIAEQTGLIHELGEWVLRTACATLAHQADLEIAVNLSAVQLKRGKVAEMVEGVLAETGLDPRRLELEITESVMVDGAEAVIADLRQVKDMGVKIAMDDFGTGYSSLSLLSRLPFNRLKIDRAFIADYGERQDSTGIADTIIDLCRHMHLQITAEGVETAAQARRLAQRGVPLVQGYLFSPPVPAAEAAAMIDRQWPVDACSQQARRHAAVG
jgi:EAL domain-containing protein (putative c-di-GMP-specific phosphodiesterase class I)